MASPRPIRLEAGSTYTSGGIDYQIESITQDEYESIGLKTTAGLGPDRVFYSPGFPTGLLSFYPLSSSSVTLSLVVLVQVSQFADLTTDYSLAPGYERALVFSLAEESGPDFEREVPPTVTRGAMNARRIIKRVNHTVPQLEMGEVHIGGLERFYRGI